VSPKGQETRPGAPGNPGKRILRVGMSGVVATALDVGALIALVELAGVHVTLAAFLAATLGGVTNFLVNKYWAFQDRAPLEIRQITLYAMVSLVTAAFVAVSVHILAVLIGLPYLAAKGIAAALVFLVWTYPAQARLVFPVVAPGIDEPLAGDSMSELKLAAD
jgi:putative flippase GtrA